MLKRTLTDKTSGSRIKKTRLMLKMPISKLGDICGISDKRLRNIEIGLVRAGPSEIVDICICLGINPNKLFAFPNDEGSQIGPMGSSASALIGMISNLSEDQRKRVITYIHTKLLDA